MRMLITGFDPFGGLDHNPSAEIVRALQSANSNLDTMVLPTSYERAWSELDSRISNSHYDAYVLWGFYRKAPWPRLDLVAGSHDRSRLADNDGVRRRGAIDFRHPDDLSTDLDAAAVAERLSFPVVVNDDPSGFVCNHTYFRLLAWLVDHGRPKNAIFVHIPDRYGRLEIQRAAQIVEAIGSVVMTARSGKDAAGRAR